jgi:hypothetical protein
LEHDIGVAYVPSWLSILEAVRQLKQSSLINLVEYKDILYNATGSLTAHLRVENLGNVRVRVLMRMGSGCNHHDAVVSTIRL